MPELTTTVPTSTVTELAADSRLAGGSGQRTGRRFVAILAMLVGAVAGGALVLDVNIAAALCFVTGLLVLTGLAACRVSAVAAPWTAPP